jgi:hypothetical protein
MVGHGLVRTLAAPLGAVFALLLLAAAPVLAEDTVCEVSVDPPAAAAGSLFTFSGSGFSPTQLILQKGSASPIVSDLDVGTDDPWQAEVQSRPGDEGEWTATFLVEGGCAPSVRFSVTLSNTDLVSDILTNDSRSSTPLLLYVLVVGIGLAGGALLARRLDEAQSRVRH